MKIQVLDDDGREVFAFDPAANVRGTFVAKAVGSEVSNLLLDASHYLTADQHVIASIKADIQGIVARIETELGAHPAFTWAQTKLGNAAAHLEAYVKGNWTEPFWPTGTVLDQRGMIVPPPANGVATPAA